MTTQHMRAHAVSQLRVVILSQVKERILQFLAVCLLRGDTKGSILCLLGPPGIGKTSLGEKAPRCARDAPEMRPRCARDTPEMRPRCARDAPEMRPRCTRGDHPHVR